MRLNVDVTAEVTCGVFLDVRGKIEMVTTMKMKVDPVSCMESEVQCVDKLYSFGRLLSLDYWSFVAELATAGLKLFNNQDGKPSIVGMIASQELVSNSSMRYVFEISKADELMAETARRLAAVGIADKPGIFVDIS